VAFVGRISQGSGVWSGELRQRQIVLDNGALAELKAILREVAQRYGDSTLATAINGLSPSAAVNPDASITRAFVLTEASNGFAVEITITTIATRQSTSTTHVFAFAGSENVTKRRTTLRDALAQIASSFGHGPLATDVSTITP